MDASADAVINMPPARITGRFWQVERRHRRNGRMTPIRLTFADPVNGVEVSAHIIRCQTEGDREYRPFRFFDLFAGPQEGWKP